MTEGCIPRAVPIVFEKVGAATKIKRGCARHAASRLRLVSAARRHRDRRDDQHQVRDIIADYIYAFDSDVHAHFDAERLKRSPGGCRVLRESPKLSDLARTTRIYVELLAAVYSLDLSPDERARIDCR
jgi:hypothetical protein